MCKTIIWKVSGCLVLGFFLVLLLPTGVSANDWTYTQNFDALSPGDLNGQDSWTTTSGLQSVTTDSYDSASQSVKAYNLTDAHYARTVTASTDGEVCVALNVENSTSLINVNIDDGAGTNGIIWYLYSDGKIHYYNSTTFTDSGVTHDLNSWHTYCFRFNSGTDLWAYNIDGGSYSSNFSTYSALTQMSRIKFILQPSSLKTVYYDTIEPLSSGGGDSEVTYATTTGTSTDQTLGNIAFGIGILVFYASIAFVAFLHHLVFKKRKHG